MTKWHYCTGWFNSPDDLLVTGLKPLGELGWELIFLERINTVTEEGGPSWAWFAVFKRPVEE